MKSPRELGGDVVLGVIPFGGSIEGILGGLTVSSKTLGVLASLVLLIVRGILLWVVVPLGCITWVIVSPWLHKRGVAIGQFLA